MIGRIWHGWTKPGNAQAYEMLLRTAVLPGIHRIAGYRGAYLLSRAAGDEVEFVTLTLWDSMAAVDAFAGADHGAVVPPAAQKLLDRFEDSSLHYDATWCP
ncbi:MAG: antibiotic biosynthesis monooxygenase family protein [Alphaproteobacteria bacterium]